MSDFIFSSKKIKNNLIENSFKTIYKDTLPNIKKYHGEWGSLGVTENFYNGFNTYENKDAIILVIGGPILMFRENNFINNITSSEGTEAIYKRWKNGKMKWDEDLSGPFTILIINKKTSNFICITDLMSFIPVYSFNNSKELVLSTHVDALAKLTEKTDNIDKVSVTDFILHGIITYPFTMYKHIYQVLPASIITKEKNSIKTKEYWLPKDNKEYTSITKAAKDIRESLIEYVNKITSQTTKIAQFISGGEDSRVLAGIMKYHSKDAIIYLDEMNREGEIAAQISKIYNGDFKPFIRETLYYLNILPESSSLVGSSSQYQHAHTYGLHEKSKLNSYHSVFGGLFADALLKGIRIKKNKIAGKLPFLPEIKTNECLSDKSLSNMVIKKKYLLDLKIRRESHLNLIKRFRSNSANEWFNLWPSSMNPAIPNFHVNRRLFQSYEPFLANKIVKIAATVPQKWKLNRRLFHKMAKPLLKPSKFIMHGEGWFPYYSWVLKSLTYPFVYITRKIAKKIGIINNNQGPWSEWDELIQSEKWEKMIEEYKVGSSQFEDIFKQDINILFKSMDLDISQKVNLLQLLYRNIK